MDPKRHNQVDALVQALLDNGNRLKSLRVSYSSCFWKNLGEAREELDYPRTGEPRKCFIKDENNDLPMIITRYHVDYVFRQTRVLGSLKRLAGRVEDIIIDGDIRLSYIYELTNAIVGQLPPSILAVKRKREEENAEETRKSRYKGTKDYATYMREFNEKHSLHQDDPGREDRIRREMRVSPTLTDVWQYPETGTFLERLLGLRG